MPTKATQTPRQVIYTIKCKNQEVRPFYIGSTINPKKRKKHHKEYTLYEKTIHYDYPVYKYIREHGGWSNWEFKEVKTYYGVDTKELRRLEQEYIDLNGGVQNLLNCQRAAT